MIASIAMHKNKTSKTITMKVKTDIKCLLDRFDFHCGLQMELFNIINSVKYGGE